MGRQPQQPAHRLVTRPAITATYEPAWHRRERSQRADARTLLRVAAARTLLEPRITQDLTEARALLNNHHSAQQVDTMSNRHQGYIGARPGGYQQPSTGKGRDNWSQYDAAPQWHNGSKGRGSNGKGNQGGYYEARNYQDHNNTYQQWVPKRPPTPRQPSQPRSPRPRSHQPRRPRSPQPRPQPLRQVRLDNHITAGTSSNDDALRNYEAFVDTLPAFGYQRGFANGNQQHNYTVQEAIINDTPEAFANEVLHYDKPGTSTIEVNAWLTNKDIELRKLAAMVQTLQAQQIQHDDQSYSIASIKRQLLDYHASLDIDAALARIRQFKDGYKMQVKNTGEFLIKAQHQHEIATSRLNTYTILEQELLDPTAPREASGTRSARAVDVELHPKTNPALQALAAPPTPPTRSAAQATRDAAPNQLPVPKGAPLQRAPAGPRQPRTFSPPNAPKTASPELSPRSTVQMGLAYTDKEKVLKEALAEVKQQAATYKDQLILLQTQLAQSEGNITAGCSWAATIKDEKQQLLLRNMVIQAQLDAQIDEQQTILQEAVQQTAVDYEKKILHLRQEAHTAQVLEEHHQQAATTQHNSNGQLSQELLQLKQQLKHHQDTAQLKGNSEDTMAKNLCIQKDKRYDELLATAESSHRHNQQQHQEELDASNAQHRQALTTLEENLHKAHTETKHHEQQAHAANQGLQQTGQQQHQAALDAAEIQNQRQLHDQNQQALTSLKAQLQQAHIDMSFYEQQSHNEQTQARVANNELREQARTEINRVADQANNELQQQRAQAAALVEAQKHDMSAMATAQATAIAQAATLTESNRRARDEAQQRADEATKAEIDSEERLVAARLSIQAGEATSKTDQRLREELQQESSEQAQALAQTRQLLADSTPAEEPRRKSPRGGDHATTEPTTGSSSTGPPASDLAIPTEPKFPKNTYFMWVEDNRERIKQELHLSESKVHPSSELGQQWKVLDPAIKQSYNDKYDEAVKQYRAELARFSTATKMAFCQQHALQATPSTPIAADQGVIDPDLSPTPEADAEDTLSADLGDLIDDDTPNSQPRPHYDIPASIDQATKEAVVRYMEIQQGELILHGQLIAWFQEATNRQDPQERHIRETVQYMIQEQSLHILTEPTLPNMDDNYIALISARYRHPATTAQTTPASWPSPPGQQALVPLQASQHNDAGESAYPGSDEEEEDNPTDTNDAIAHAPTTPRKGVTFNMADGTTPENVPTHDHCQHFPTWSTQAAPLSDIPSREIPDFPEAQEHKQTRGTSRKTHSPTGEHSDERSPPRTSEQGYPSGKSTTL